jgi:hypothetical protein
VSVEDMEPGATALRDARLYRGLAPEEVDARARLPPGTCARYERRAEDAATAEGLLGRVAVALSVPVARLITPTGRSADAAPGGCGALVRHWRHERGLTPEQVAGASGVAVGVYVELEAGRSGVESRGVELLRLAEALDVPLFDFVAPF